jgi:hypothetical protein
MSVPRVKKGLRVANQPLDYLDRDGPLLTQPQDKHTRFLRGCRSNLLRVIVLFLGANWCLPIVSGTSMCMTASLASYISMGSNGCTADGVAEVKNVTYSTISSDGSPQPTADQLTVFPSAIFGPLNKIATSPVARWTVVAGQSLEIDLGFTLDGIIPDAVITLLDDVISGTMQFPTGVGVSVDTHYCLGTITGGACSGQSATVHWNDGGHPFGIPQPPLVTVQETFSLHPTSGELIASDIFPQSLDKTPEPNTFWLLALFIPILARKACS